MRISDWRSVVCSSDLLVAWGAGAVERRGQILLGHVEPHRELADGIERAACDGALRHRQVDAQRLEPLRQLDEVRQFAIGTRQIGLRHLMFDGAHADDAFAACGAGGHAEYPSMSDWRELRSEEHTSELQSLMRISYAVFCLKKKK